MALISSAFFVFVVPLGDLLGAAFTLAISAVPSALVAVGAYLQSNSKGFLAE